MRAGGEGEVSVGRVEAVTRGGKVPKNDFSILLVTPLHDCLLFAGADSAGSVVGARRTDDGDVCPAAGHIRAGTRARRPG